MLTLIYTSGTTGPPKGVELTHANLMAELDALDGYFPLTHEDTIVSYLLDAHIANRWERTTATCATASRSPPSTT